jgi:hypothetical protein
MAVIQVASFLKDPDEKLDYGFDWSSALGTDTISNSTWIAPSGITTSSPTNNDTTTTVWLEAGTDGADYVIVNRITTAAGRIFEASFLVLLRSTG